MADEIEAKIQLKSEDFSGKRDIRKKLEQIIHSHGHGCAIHDIEENNYIYAMPGGGYLRIRKEHSASDSDNSVIDYENKVILTYKGKNKIAERLNCRKEIPAELNYKDDSGSADEAYRLFKSFFEGMEFKFYAEYYKKRREMNFPWGDRFKISIDEIEQLPILRNEFIEIEGSTTKQVHDVMKKLGLEGRTIIHESYADLVRRCKHG